MDSSHFSQLHASEVTASGSRGLLRYLKAASLWNRTRDLWPWLRNWIYSDGGERQDHFSELPDSLIISILSLLPMPDVAATMLLSKRWLHLWTTVPYLDFTHYHHPLYHNNLPKYIDFVNGALANWKGSKIQKFRLTFYSDDDSFVDSWVLFAIEKQVEELVVDDGLDGLDGIESNEYCLPQRLYSCSSITKLSLSFWHFCELRVDEDVQMNRLKSLAIQCLDSLREDAMSRILAGAPLLEELSLHVVDFGENLNIRSTRLKKLEVDLCVGTLYEKVLKIWAPNLLDLEISGLFFGICLLDVPSLTKAEVSFQQSHGSKTYWNLPPVGMFHRVFQSICHVEKLTLSDFTIKTLLRMKRNDLVVKFVNTKTLYLYTGEAEEMLGVLDMFPNLTMLRVHLDMGVYTRLKREDGLCNVDVSKADLPSPSVLCLKKVEITWFMRDVSIIPAVEILLENAKLLNKLVFWQLWCSDNRDVLLSTSASSATVETIIVRDCSKHGPLLGYLSW